MRLFPRREAVLSMIHNRVLDMIFEKYQHLLLLNPESLSAQDLLSLSKAVSRKTGVSGLKTCFGFIDGTVRPVCRPTDIQHQHYNGHKRQHALKYQGIIASNGIFLEMFGPCLGRDHDARLLHESNLLERLERLPKPLSYGQDGPEDHLDLPFCLYGDPAYPLSETLLKPRHGARLSFNDKLFNYAMSRARQAVEWGFGLVIGQWAFVDFKKNQKIGLQQVGKMYLVTVLLSNIKNCIEPNLVSTYFGIGPPELEDYLNGYFVRLEEEKDDE
jgi:nuclease HARBI1